MDITHSEPDALIISQQRLFEQIKQSHHLFIAQLYAALLYIPLLAILFLFFGPPALEKFPSNFTTIAFLVVIAILSLKQIKDTYSFYRESNRYFTRIAHAPEPSQLSIGLTSYVNHLLKLLQPPTLRGRKPPAPLPERLEQLESHLKRGFYRSLMEFIISGALIINLLLYFRMASPEAIASPLFYVILVGFLGIPAIRLWLFVKWRPFAKRWLLGFQELVAWGENLERLFLQQQETGGHG